MMSNKVDVLQGTLDMLILKALTWEPMHGFGIGRWIEQVTDDRLRIEEGALYPALHRLHRQGLVAADWGVSANNRRAKYYRLTKVGRRELQARIRGWESASAVINQVLAAESV